MNLLKMDTNCLINKLRRFGKYITVEGRFKGVGGGEARCRNRERVRFEGPVSGQEGHNGHISAWPPV